MMLMSEALRMVGKQSTAPFGLTPRLRQNQVKGSIVVTRIEALAFAALETRRLSITGARRCTSRAAMTTRITRLMLK